MTTYKIRQIDFLTERPDNNFEGNPVINAALQQEWIGEVIECKYEPDTHLDEVLNFIEDDSGWLVGHVTIECTGRLDPETPSSFVEEFESQTGFYPKGWTWVRKVTLLK